MKTVRAYLLALGVLLAGTLQPFSQATGNLQIHYVDVGQGDGAVVITPQGKTILFDSGARVAPHKMAAYLQQLGVTKVDCLITSHFHVDHCGDVANLVSEIGMPTVVYDRGTPQNPSGVFVRLGGAARLDAARRIPAINPKTALSIC